MRSFSRFFLRWLPLGLLVSTSCGINNGIYACIDDAGDRCFDYGTVDQLPAATKCGLISGGSLQSSTCPAANRVGSCARSAETVRYYPPTYDATSAQTACNADGGTFSAP